MVHFMKNPINMDDWYPSFRKPPHVLTPHQFKTIPYKGKHYLPTKTQCSHNIVAHRIQLAVLLGTLGHIKG